VKPQVLNYTNGQTRWANKLGKLQYVAQLNAAGRMAAQNLGMHVADFAVMADGFTWEQSLRDCHHPTEELLQVTPTL
jgi:hypothetical protein